VAEMRRWAAVLVVLSGMAAIPAASSAVSNAASSAVANAVEPGRAAGVKVTVRPRSGSASTRFAVSFRAAVTTGRSLHDVYRITASRAARRGCQSAVAVVAPASKAGSTVRVTLGPGRSKHWCAGTFGGQVWDVITEAPCPINHACPAIEPAPQLVGKFNFRVTRP
jgi:hypothetical protein